MKIKILKFLIKKNGFFDRERLVALNEKPLISILICKIYRAFLQNFSKEKKPKIAEKKQKHHMERISAAKGHINNFSRLKFKLRKLWKTTTN